MSTKRSTSHYWNRLGKLYSTCRYCIGLGKGPVMHMSLIGAYYM